MRKMPCLVERDFSDKRRPKMLGTITPGCEWVLAGEGTATRKWDGTACLVRDGNLFKRYDAKRGKQAPPGFEACCEPDPITGHCPGWLPVDVRNPDPADVWHALAWAQDTPEDDFTYELVGPKINSNHEGESVHRFVRHGSDLLTVPRTLDGIRSFLEAATIEGIVFWRSTDRDCEKVKIRRDDFGFSWPVK
jgi:hypothetical protein